MLARSTRLWRRLLVLVMLAVSARHAGADGAGDALLQRCVDTEARTQTLHAEFEQRIDSGGPTIVRTGTLALKKPNKGHISYREEPGQQHIVLHSDGQTLFRYAPAENEYTKSPIDPAGGNFGNLFAKVFFYSDTLNQFRSQGTSAKIAGSIAIGGLTCKRLKILGTPPGTGYQFYIGPDGLLRGMRFESLSGTQKFSEEHRYWKVQAAAAAIGVAMAWKLPKDARLHHEENEASNAPDPGTQTQQELLKPGTKAPDFKLPGVTGGMVSLSAVYRGKRAILLNFWNAASDPGREELTPLSALLAELKSKGFDVLTVDSGDSVGVIHKLWSDKNLSLRAAWKGDGVVEQYHVLAIPTNYVIGGNGRIIAHFEGFDEGGIRKALAAVGIR